MLCSMSGLARCGFLTVTSGDSLPASPKILCLMFIAPLHSVELKRRLWAIRERAGMRQPGCVSKQDSWRGRALAPALQRRRGFVDQLLDDRGYRLFACHHSDRLA